jgi:hypothetical protein
MEELMRDEPKKGDPKPEPTPAPTPRKGEQ